MVLPRFTIPEEQQVVVPEQTMRDAVAAMFRSVGMSAEEADECTDVLVVSDLRGNDSHGVSNMLRSYMEGFVKGQNRAGGRGPNPRPQFEIISEQAGTAVVDADGALGIHVGTYAMKLAVEKAKTQGVGSVVVRNAGHFGAIGYFTDLAAEAGCLGQGMLGGGSGAMMPPFGAEKKLSTNPIAWSAPAKEETPFRMDVATTQARPPPPSHPPCFLFLIPPRSSTLGATFSLHLCSSPLPPTRVSHPPTTTPCSLTLSAGGGQQDRASAAHGHPALPKLYRRRRGHTHL